MIVKEIVRLRFILIPLLLMFWYPLPAQAPDTPFTNAFDSALVNFALSAPLKHASWGFCAVDIKTGEEYRSVNGHLALMPASTLKPFTSAAVLSLLGSDFRFKTTVSVSGSIDTTGTLSGNIHIKGGGDPTLGSPRFGSATVFDSLLSDIYTALQQYGIEAVQGCIIADASYFTSVQVIPSWQYEDIGNHYGAGASGLSVNDNIVTFIFNPGRREGEPAELVGTRPEAPYLEVVNDVTTGPRGSGDRVNVYGSPLSNLRWLRGTVPAGVRSFEVAGTLPDPAYHLAFSLHEYLTAKGISVAMQPATKLRIDWMGESDTLPQRQIHVCYSPPLAEIVQWINFRSVNLYAEALVKTAGKELAGEGSTEAGLEAVMQYWQQKGVDLSGVSLKDGSGLSRKNLVTAGTLAHALAAYTGEKSWQLFYESFPVAGVSGTVASLFRRGAAKGNLRAKSGTIEKVKGFSGYASTASGRNLAYSVMVNNYSGTHKELIREIEILLTKMCEISD